MLEQSFWVDDPISLLKDLNPFPNSSMTMNERYNAFTRLVIIITVVMFYMDFQYALQFFLLALLFIIILKYSSKKKEENFGIPPTYIEGSCPMTTVPPLYAEEWQIPPPIYDEYSLIPEEQVNSGEQYPYPVYGQYMTKSSVLPYQEGMMNNRPLRDLKPFMTDEFSRNAIQFREDMIRPFVNKINREYRHGCFDQISPYSSW